MRVVLPLSALVLLASGPGCTSDSDVQPFILRVEPTDVVQSAVREIEIDINPSLTDLNTRFMMVPEQTYDAGEISTSLSPVGSFVIRISQSWIMRHALPGEASFAVEVPLYAAGISRADAPDPVVTVTLLRNGERIADSNANLPWPLPEAGNVLVKPMCRSAFRTQCTDNDP